MVLSGVFYADELRVRRVNIVEVTATWAEIRDDVVYNFVATSANIGYAVIGDGEIAAGAVTNSNYGSNTINLPPTGSWQTVCGVSLPTSKHLTISSSNQPAGNGGWKDMSWIATSSGLFRSF